MLLVEAEAQCKAAEEALKGLRDTLKREKRKDEKAMADAEKKRNKMKDAQTAVSESPKTQKTGSPKLLSRTS